MIDTNVNLGGLNMATPLTTASGTFGYGTEYVGAVDYTKLGAITAKGIRVDPWPGNPMPRHCEVPGGLVNAIGLQGTGIKHFLDITVPWYADSVGEAVGGKAPPMIVNIWGGSVDEYAAVARQLGEYASANPDSPIAALECNVSCPNVKAGGHTFGQDPVVLNGLVNAVRKETKLPLIVKLAPNVPDIRPYVKACEDAGADALALINTIPAMVIDIEKRRPVLANKTGGLSGRGIHPAAVKVVYDAYRATKLPILAMGGVYEAKDAIEFMLAGATAVALGTALFTDPDVVSNVYDGMLSYCERHGFSSMSELTGALEG
ncbi:MAG: dihydroorotate dehydrogenase [Kiritimatiellae bacterium]|nr:dihydroorotate dehydrogenase [Kiritimatiellia bacterium]